MQASVEPALTPSPGPEPRERRKRRLRPHPADLVQKPSTARPRPFRCRGCDLDETQMRSRPPPVYAERRRSSHFESHRTMVKRAAFAATFCERLRGQEADDGSRTRDLRLGKPGEASDSRRYGRFCCFERAVQYGRFDQEGCPRPLPGRALPGPLPGLSVPSDRPVRGFRPAPNPALVRSSASAPPGPFWYAKWSRNGRP